MIGTSVPRQSLAATVLRVLVPFDTIALLFAGIVHLFGAHIPLGVATFDEPPIVPAGIVEGLAGIFFVLAVYAVFARQPWAWVAVLVAHLFAISGFVLGIVVTRNGTTPFNHVYHYVMLVVFVVGLMLLWLPGVRASLDGQQ